MVRRDVFARVPGEGRWSHVLLADGNIGIGGDPVRLLVRAAGLVAAGGTLLVETDPAPERNWRGTVQVCSASRCGPPTRWARVGAAVLSRLAASRGLTVLAERPGSRAFVELAVRR
jgi:hypothetical protein